MFTKMVVTAFGKSDARSPAQLATADDVAGNLTLVGLPVDTNGHRYHGEERTSPRGDRGRAYIAADGLSDVRQCRMRHGSVPARSDYPFVKTPSMSVELTASAVKTRSAYPWH